MLKRRIALAVALLALLAGGTAVALGATGSGHGGRSGHRHVHGGAGHGLLRTASTYLGIPANQVRSELGAGKTLAQIADATPGKSEAGLVSALVAAGRQRLQSASAKLTTRVQALVQGKRGALRHHRLGAARQRFLRTAAIAYLGIGRKTLAADLRSGKTLAQIADATPGKSAAGLSQALLEAATKRLDARSGAGGLGKKAEAARLAKLGTRIQSVVNRSHARLRARKPTG